MSEAPARAAGLLLAAGRGRRLGQAKATLVGQDGVPWVVAAARVLHDAGCAPVVVAVGAEGATVRALLDGADVEVVEVADWASGMGASLRAGIEALTATDADLALVHLVDLPDVGADVAARVLRDVPPGGLARATYAGRPGHPVALAREHWAPLLQVLAGDRGASGYLADRVVVGVECGDLARGTDVDTPEALAEHRAARPHQPPS